MAFSPQAMTEHRAKHLQVVPPDLRARCGRGYVPKRLLNCTLPPLFPGTTLEELDLPARARKFFKRKHYMKRPTAVAKLSVRDLAAVRGLGLTSIIDTVEALHRCAKLRGFKPKNFDLEEVSRPPEIAPRAFVQCLKDIRELPAAMRDYRLPPLPPGTMLADLRLRGRALKFFQQNNLIDAPEKLAQLTLADLVSRGGIGVGTVTAIIEAIYCQTDAPRQKATLDKEILDWIAPKGKIKQREIVCLYYGLFGKPQRTSRELSEAYGCSHQAIHQYCRPLTAVPSSVVQRFQDASDAAISAIPSPATAVESRLARQRLLERGTRLEAILRISQLLKCDAPFVLRGKGRHQRVLLAMNDTHKRFQELLRKLSEGSPMIQSSLALAAWNDAGNATLDPSTIEQIVSSTERARWLDRTNGWFWFDRGGSPLRRRIEKALAAAGRLTVEELAAAVWRGPRAQHWLQPPLEVFKELCRQLPESRVRGDIVSAAHPVSAQKRLRGDERILVDFLCRQRRPCHLDDLRSFAISAGISEDSLWQNFVGSPALKQYAPLHYGIVGLQSCSVGVTE
jgi:hypothetical protein